MRRASVVMEYALVLGLVSVILLSMQVFIKRGVQGRLEQMSDYFISKEHLVEVSPSKSTTNTTSDLHSESQAFIGGSTKLDYGEDKQIDARSEVREDSSTHTTSFFPAQRRQFPAPVHGKEPEPEEMEDNPEYQDYQEEQAGLPADVDEEVEVEIPDFSEMIDIGELQAVQQQLEELAQTLEEEADALKARGEELYNTAIHMDCHGRRSCRRARTNMVIQSQRMIEKAEELRQKAQEVRVAAEEVGERIALLGGSG